MLTTIPVLLILRPNIVVISVPPGQAAVGTFAIAKMFKKKLYLSAEMNGRIMRLESQNQELIKKLLGYSKVS